jgi:hypothetical protein
MTYRMMCIGLGTATVLAACSSPPASHNTTASPSTEAAAPAAEHAMPAGDPKTDDEIVKVALSAAPADVAAGAAIVEPNADGTMRQIRAGTNGFACMAHPEVMCLDKSWQEWADAWMKKTSPKVTAVGIGYMLQGDKGASNTDPYATAPTPDNQWIVSPPHIMVLTPDTQQLAALPTDPNNGGPWVMWKGTPYAHIMVPTVPMKK